MGLITVDQFRTRTIMPSDDVDGLETQRPGFLQAQIDDWTEYMYSKLRKRYVVPFGDPPPRTAVRWLVKLVTKDAYDARGRNPASDNAGIDAAAANALKEIDDAADSAKGLFELPLLQDGTAGGVSQGGPLGYSEASPYKWTDLQVDTGRSEDGNG